MPYITPQQKVTLKYHDNQYPENAGELNYCFTMLIKKYLNNHKVCYQTYNDIIGALESAKLELYRRKIAPYEGDKIRENGDVWD